MKKTGQIGHRGTNAPRNDQSYTPRTDDTKMHTRNGVYTAKVIDNSDPDYNGNIWVQLTDTYNNSSTNTQEERHRYFTKVRQVQPHGGRITGENFSTQYGSVNTPPSIDTEVLVVFTETNQEGFLLGSLIPAGGNASIPGLGSSVVEGEEDVVAPTLEKGSFTDQQGSARPRHPIAEKIAEQGIALDPIRGIGSESNRRESPSNVSGFSSPSGHSIVLDDGTYEFVEGANYTPDSNRQSGTNKLIRIRSSGGAQILLNDEAGIFYIISHTGNSWIQMDSEGNVDVWAAKNISYTSEDSINFYAADAFNIEADIINIKARGDTLNLESAASDINLYATKNANITALNMNQKADADIKLTSGGNIHLNGPSATTASKTVPEPHPTNRNYKESINSRVPEHEPYGRHRNNSSYIAAPARSSVQTGTGDFDLS